MKNMKYIVAFLVCTGIANAAIIIPSSVTDTGSANAAGDAGSALANLINGSGLSGTPVDDGTTAGDVTHSVDDLAHLWTTAPSAPDYFETIAGTTQLDFDLGGAYDVKSAYIWGYYYSGPVNSATAITVSFSTNGTTFANAKNISLDSPPSSDVPAQAVDLRSAPAGTTHVRFLFTGNSGGDRCALAEVRFGTASVAQDPVVISSFTASPSVVTNGGTTTLSWATANEDTLTLDQGIGDVTLLTSTQVVVNAEITYTLTAENSLGNTNESVLIKIVEEVAGTIIQPTAVVSEEFMFNSASDTINNDRMETAVNNGDSLTSALGATHEFGGTYDGSYVSTDRNGVTNFFLAAQDDSPVDIVYDLTVGGDIALDGIVLWNYENNGGGGTVAGNALRTFEVRVNTEAEGDSTFSGPATLITLKPVWDGDEITTNDLGGVNSAQFFRLGAQNGRYVQVSLTDNYLGFQGIDGGGDRIGFGEIRFATGSGYVADPIENLTITGPVAITGGQGMVLAWDTSNGQEYDVQSKSNLITQLTWETITSVTGTGGGITVTTAVDNAETFYQVATPTL